MATISEKLAGFAHDLTYNDIPQHVIEKIKLHMLDFLGICFVSSKMEFAEVVYKTAASMGKGEEATVVGIGKRLPMVGAAMVNGALAHGIDFDDTHIKAIVHVSAPLVAGGLAVGEAKNVSGRKLLESLAAGMETAIRLGMVAEGRFNDRGLHQTANLSPFGICLTACKLLDVPQENSINGLGDA